MFVTNWISTTKIQKISEITNFFRHYFLSRTEVIQSTSGGIGKGMYDVSQQNNETVRLLLQIPYKSPLIHT